MVTKYILHGGNTAEKSEDNKRFFREIVKDLKNQANVLIVYFARNKKEWPKLFRQDIRCFRSFGRRKDIDLVLAKKNIRYLIGQIKDAGAIYMRGGKTFRIKEVLQKVKNLRQLFQGKVVAGSSAGAYVLAKYYINSGGQLGEGLDILPIKIIAHYNTADQKRLLEKLKNYREPLKTYTIAEHKFVVLKRRQ